MLRGYRGVIAKAGLIAALASLALAFLAIGYAVIHGLEEQAIYEQEARNAHAVYSQNASAEVKRSCAAVPSPERASCLKQASYENANDQNDNRREYADLVAQRTSALWTKIMGIAALVGMGLSAVGVVLVWTTFNETRKANEIAKELGREQLRPWVQFEIEKARRMAFEFEEVVVEAALNLVNVGSSPALNIRTFGKIYFDSVDSEKIYRDIVDGFSGISEDRSDGTIFNGKDLERTVTATHKGSRPEMAALIVVFACCYRASGAKRPFYTARIFDATTNDPELILHGPNYGKMMMPRHPRSVTHTGVDFYERRGISGVAT